jgi:hypothetical protein
MRKIRVSIDTMGNSKIEAENFVGMSCEAATGPIEKALSSGAVTRDLKGEYFQEAEASQEVQQSW